jgi:hypothetical protein
MTDDRDAEVLSQLPRPEDISMDGLQEIDGSALAHLLRWLRHDPDQSDGTVSRFNSYI